LAQKITLRSSLCILSHIADDSLPAVVHMDVLNANSLLTAIPQASKNLNLGCINPEDLSARSNASFAKRRLKGRARTPDTAYSAPGRKEVGNDDT
jgi:hypothetical protein